MLVLVRRAYHTWFLRGFLRKPLEFQLLMLRILKSPELCLTQEGLASIGAPSIPQYLRQYVTWVFVISGLTYWVITNSPDFDFDGRAIGSGITFDSSQIFALLMGIADRIGWVVTILLSAQLFGSLAGIPRAKHRYVYYASAVIFWPLALLFPYAMMQTLDLCCGYDIPDNYHAVSVVMQVALFLLSIFVIYRTMAKVLHLGYWQTFGYCILTNIAVVIVVSLLQVFMGWALMQAFL